MSFTEALIIFHFVKHPYVNREQSGCFCEQMQDMYRHVNVKQWLRGVFHWPFSWKVQVQNPVFLNQGPSKRKPKRCRIKSVSIQMVRCSQNTIVKSLNCFESISQAQELTNKSGELLAKKTGLNSTSKPLCQAAKIGRKGSLAQDPWVLFMPKDFNKDPTGPGQDSRIEAKLEEVISDLCFAFSHHYRSPPAHPQTCLMEWYFLWSFYSFQARLKHQEQLTVFRHISEAPQALCLGDDTDIDSDCDSLSTISEESVDEIAGMRTMARRVFSAC